MTTPERPRRPRAPRRRRSAGEHGAIQLLNGLGAELSSSASDEDVRSAYRRLVRESHPDRHHDAQASVRDAQARRLRAIVAAWRAFEQAQAHASAA